MNDSNAAMLEQLRRQSMIEAVDALVAYYLSIDG